MTEIVQQFLLNYTPLVVAVIAFITTIIKVTKTFKDVLDKSTLDNVIDNINLFVEENKEDIKHLEALVSTMIIENRKLREQNAELLTQITKIEHKVEE